MQRALVMVIALGALTGPLCAQTAPLQTGDSILPFRGGTVLWAFNPGTDTVWVDTLFLSACRNVQNDCVAIPLDLPIPPNEGRRLLRITPQFAREAFNYRWTFSWRSVTKGQDPSDLPVPEPDGEQDDDS